MKYELPKILLVDIDSSTARRLEEDGFNVFYGSLGGKYPVKNFMQCETNESLSNLYERDIVIIDLRETNMLGYNPLMSNQWERDCDIALSAGNGDKFFYPKNLALLRASKDLNEIMKQGGSVIVFSDNPKDVTYYTLHYENSCKTDYNSVKLSNYDGLPLEYITAKTIRRGNEIIIDDGSTISNRVFKNCNNDVYFDCIFQFDEDDNTKVLARNRLGDPISFVRIIENDENFGLLFVLPQFNDPYVPIRNLLFDVLPDILPSLLTDLVKNSWLFEELYELPEIKKMKEELFALKENNKENENNLEKKISTERDKYYFLNGILTSDGYSEALVDRVYETLKYIGYSNIVKSDQETTGNLQEDLKIIGEEKLTLIEVKGHNGSPTEDDVQALVKYMSRKMREKRSTDIDGILIINHNKMLPPLERSNPAFTPEQINDASENYITLVSTWDLYKAVRLLQNNILSFSDIDKALHTYGLFAPLSAAWQHLGAIQKTYKENTVICFILEAMQITVGDELLIESGNDYYISRIGEMMINDVSVPSAKHGDRVSIKVDKPVFKHAAIFVRN